MEAKPTKLNVFEEFARMIHDREHDDNVQFLEERNITSASIVWLVHALMAWLELKKKRLFRSRFGWPRQWKALAEIKIMLLVTGQDNRRSMYNKIPGEEESYEYTAQAEEDYPRCVRVVGVTASQLNERNRRLLHGGRLMLLSTKEKELPKHDADITKNHNLGNKPEFLYEAPVFLGGWPLGSCSY